MIPVEGTFEYVAIVPDMRSPTFSCVVDSFGTGFDEPTAPGGNNSGVARLRRRSYTEPWSTQPFRRPQPVQPRSSRQEACDYRKSLLPRRPGIGFGAPSRRPALHGGTGCGRIGVSAIREQELIFGVGAITAVPQGRDFQARIPSDLSLEAEAIFRKRDPSFEFFEHPIDSERAKNGKFAMAAG